MTPSAPEPGPTPSPRPKPTELTPIAPPPPSGEVTVTGTLEAGVESGCLLLEGYLIINGDPAVIRAGHRVKVTGRVDYGIVSYCQQGIPLVVTSAEPA